MATRYLSFIVGFVLVQGAWAEPQQVLVASHTTESIPLDPMAEGWKQAKPVTVELSGQLIATIKHADPTVTQITARSLHDGTEVAFHLTWEDPTEDRFQTIGRFSDAVAVQIPYRPSPAVPFTMGAEGRRVLILHWGAFREENIENGYADTAKIYPHYYYDWYPHAEAPYHYPEDWHNQYALNYIGGEKLYRENTLKTSVREVVAEGFSSSTWKDIQGAEGQGSYRDGRWQVVIKRDFVEENTSNPTWGPGRTSYVTFAAWDGGNEERGARKSLTYTWIPLEIEGK